MSQWSGKQRVYPDKQSTQVNEKQTRVSTSLDVMKNRFLQSGKGCISVFLGSQVCLCTSLILSNRKDSTEGKTGPMLYMLIIIPGLPSQLCFPGLLKMHVKNLKVLLSPKELLQDPKGNFHPFVLNN